jgi:nitrogen fixation protein FixH
MAEVDTEPGVELRPPSEASGQDAGRAERSRDASRASAASGPEIAHAQPALGRAPIRRGQPGWQWPLLIVALLVGGAGANLGLMLAATGDASFAVEPDYYQKALHWDETMAQEARNAALGWTIAVVFERAAQPGAVKLTARVDDRTGHAIEGAHVAVEAFHSARARRVLRATLTAAAAGRYSATLPLDRPGLWELRLRVERGDQVFTKTLVQDLPRTP